MRHFCCCCFSNQFCCCCFANQFFSSFFNSFLPRFYKASYSFKYRVLQNGIDFNLSLLLCFHCLISTKVKFCYYLFSYEYVNKQIRCFCWLAGGYRYSLGLCEDEETININNGSIADYLRSRWSLIFTASLILVAERFCTCLISYV